MIPFISWVHRIFHYISSVFPVFPFSSTACCIFQATEPVTSCLSFTICLAIQKVLFWFSELFRSLAVSLRLFSFAKDRDVVFFAHWLLSLYFSHESWPFFLPFSIQHLLNFMPHWPHHSTTMFLYVDAVPWFLCVCSLLFPSLNFHLLPLLIYTNAWVWMSNGSSIAIPFLLDYLWLSTGSPSLQIQDAKKSPKIAIWAPSHTFVGLYLRN